MSTGPPCRLRDVRRAFGDEAVLRGLDLDVGAGEVVALLGRSGCGKSTLLRIVAGLDREATGTLEVTTSRAIVFQEPRLLPWRRVAANVALGLGGEDPEGRARSAIDQVGLSRRRDAWPATLSGGEAQRAALARALVRDPDLLLLDEPFVALDALTRADLYELLTRLWELRQPAVLLVTHDVEDAVLLADRILVMADGVIAHERAVGLPRPRHRTGPEFQAIRAEVLTTLGVTDV